MQILECRRKLRQAGRDQIEIEKLQAEMARLEQELREIDEQGRPSPRPFASVHFCTEAI
jgi:hypothetical protein